MLRDFPGGAVVRVLLLLTELPNNLLLPVAKGLPSYELNEEGLADSSFL